MLNETDVLEYVRKTNPEMTGRKLREELNKSDSIAFSLLYLVYFEKSLFSHNNI